MNVYVKIIASQRWAFFETRCRFTCVCGSVHMWLFSRGIW